jgi:ribosomal protein S18 acetylase RimI-like enzyme
VPPRFIHRGRKHPAQALPGSMRVICDGVSGMIRRRSMIGLRQGTFEDAAEIAVVWYRGWRDAHIDRVPAQLTEFRTEESFRTRATARAREMTVAVVDGVVVGFVLVVDDEVEQLYISSTHRGRGIADALLSAAEQKIAANGHTRAWLAVVPDNARARRFYERMGWRDEEAFDYEAGADGGPITVQCRRYVRDFTL